MKDRFDLESDITRTSFYAEVAEELAHFASGDLLSRDDLATGLRGLSVMLQCHQDRMFDTMKQCFKLDEYRQTTTTPKSEEDEPMSYDDFMDRVTTDWVDDKNSCRNQRYGQFIMNELYTYRPDLHEKIIYLDDPINCFYDDRKITLTTTFLRENW